MPKEQQIFLKKNCYSASSILQREIVKLMKLSKGQDLWSKPSDEPLERGSNIG